MTLRSTERRIDAWLAAVEVRVARDLDTRELHRGLRSLSATYVRRRPDVARGAALRGSAKRAAFALYYAPRHLLTVRSIARELGAAEPAPRELLDLGCGTGAAGAGWALACARPPALIGVDLHPWALGEARAGWRELGLRGRTRRGRIEALDVPDSPRAILLGWAANELAANAREALLATLLTAARRGCRVLVVEPIWRRDAAWWDRWADAVRDAGGRADEWRFELELPRRTIELARGAGLDAARAAARSLWIPGGRR